jgi:drug/metabolite transporter (DMT)-like permease
MNKKGLSLVLITAVISGVSIYINKFGVSFSDPNIFTFLKNVVVSLILTGMVLAFGNIKEILQLNLKKCLLLASIGLIGGSIPFLLFFKGLSLTSASQGSFIHKTMFIYVAIFAFIFLRERINKYFLAGAIFLMIGNLLVLKKIAFIPNAGDLYILAATLFWAGENVLSKYAMREIKADVVAWGRMFLGSIFILLYLIAIGQASKITSINLTQAGWVLITAVFLFGYVFTWYRGLAKIPATVATVILLLGSPVTTILTILTSRNINFQDFVAVFFITSGVILVALLGYEKRNKENQEFIRA